MKLRLYLLFILFLMFNFSYSQTEIKQKSNRKGYILGKVIDKDSIGIPKAYVSVIEEDSISYNEISHIQADEKGNFLLPISIGLNDVYASAYNKESLIISKIEIFAEDTIQLIFKLNTKIRRGCCGAGSCRREDNRVKKAIDKASVNQSELLSIYPNPCYGFLSVEPPVKAKKVEIFDMKGEKIYENELKDNASKFQVDLNPFLNGVYFMICTTRDQKKFYEKIVLNR